MDLKSHDRFAEPIKRRDFLGISAAWLFFSSFLIAALGSLRLPMPSVFPESNSKFRIGKPEEFPVDSATYFEVPHFWVMRDHKGFQAISSVCTHLGCITKRKGDGSFLCPCHGSRYDSTGKVTGGPAPRSLPCLALLLAPNGQLIVDSQRTIPADVRFTV